MSVTDEKNSGYYSLAAKSTVPASSTKTGTVSTAGKNVTGTGTLFRSELKPGDWIVDLSQDEVRKVDEIRDNTFLVLDSAFTADLVGAALVVVRSRVKQVSIGNTGGTNGEIDGVAIIPGQTVNFQKNGKNPDGKDFIDPVIVDPASTTIIIQNLK